MDVGSVRFSELLGSFPTPIAIVTATDGEGEPYGFTSNAVCSVSAATSTLLVSVGRGSRTLPAIMSSQAFAVNFLSLSGRTASQIFASKATDKFAHVEWRPSVVAEGAPLLTEIALGFAECRVEKAIEVSDHWLFIGRVKGAEVFPREPLLYRRGDYGAWSPLDQFSTL
ncbi:flavin reductase family protein [Streptomyces sp. V1I1]|uniref:flavin reductase family protein n=1 Tax=Streptomyces sp. V1I1 TaxID=3042272 RepID=UPI0027865066|nr:flavin reductase family protein [Streptomyces sp. V1I1]MDQ0943890.1 flavin reductase (DIM6/NTAB) family NADH-FMN oxidoreductase RutF [Streptomyces sp. V1I1]